MKAHELREMSDEQLTLTLQETSRNLFHLRMQAANADSGKPASELRKSRRLIARIQTIQNERRRQAAATQPATKQPATKQPATKQLTAGGAS